MGRPEVAGSSEAEPPASARVSLGSLVVVSSVVNGGSARIHFQLQIPSSSFSSTKS